MRGRHLGRKTLALLLTLALLVTGLPLNVFAEGLTDNRTQQTQTGTVEQTETEYETVVYREVAFALADNTTREEADATVMDAFQMVEDSTPVSALREPQRSGCLFLDWYYDAQLTEIAHGSDLITRNMTLYPRFAEKEGMEDNFGIDFISDEDVGTDYTVKLYSYGLSEEEVARRITITNQTDTADEVHFTLTAEAVNAELAFDTGLIDIDDEQREQLDMLLELAKEGGLEDGELYELLSFLELSYEDCAMVLSAYAPEELALMEPEAQSLVPLSDAEEAAYTALEAAETQLEAEGITADTAERADYVRALGLDEDDTIERWLLEDMGLTYDAMLRAKDYLGLWEDRESPAPVIYTISADWDEGQTYQVEILDTEGLRYLDGGVITDAPIIYCNFTVYKDNRDTLRLKDSIIYVAVSDTEGVDCSQSLISVNVDGDGGVNGSASDSSGTMTYRGELTLVPGSMLAVYDGVLNPDKSVDGDVTYIRITEVLGDDMYRYEAPGMLDVLDVPDVIPLFTDEDFETGVITIPAAWLDFSDSEYAELGFSADTTVDEGDFLEFFADDGSAEELAHAGYGRVTAVEETGESVTLHYEIVTEDDITRCMEYYLAPENMDIPLSDEEIALISASAEQQMRDSGYVELAGEYMTALILGDESEFDDEEFKKALTGSSFTDEDGNELSLEDVRLLAAGGGSVKIEPVSPSFSISKNLVHFKGMGEGARATVTAGFKITIQLNKVGNSQNQLVITGKIKGEQEILLSLGGSASLEWGKITKRWWSKILRKWCSIKVWGVTDCKVTAKIKVGSYTGIGFTAVVTTKSEPANKDTSWNELIGSFTQGLDLGDNSDKLINGASKLAELAEKQQDKQEKKSSTDGTVTGTLPQKYSEFIKLSSDRITLFSQKLFKVSARFALQLCEASVEGSFVISLNAKAMLGFGISFGVAKQYNFTMRAKAHTCERTETDLEVPNFRLNFYMFGMIDVRAGLKLDARIGLLSTELDSLGIILEIGVYIKVYGFLFITCTWDKSKSFTKTIQGSLLFELGLYFMIDFYAQLGSGRVGYRKTLYEKELPLVTLGSEYYPTGFEIEENDKSLTIEMKGSKGVRVPDKLFNIKQMSLKTGSESVTNKNDDKNAKYTAAYKWTANNTTYTQYNEVNFEVRCYDLTGENGTRTGSHSLIYDPASNMIMPVPGSGVYEVWAEIDFTFKNTGFGLSTAKYVRTLKVHWKADSVPVTLKYLSGPTATQTAKTETATVQAVYGGEYKLTVNDALINRYKGCRLYEIVLVKNGKRTKLSTAKGSVSSIPADSGNISIEIRYVQTEQDVTFLVMDPTGNGKVLANARATCGIGKTVEECLPNTVRQNLAAHNGYYLKWYEVKAVRGTYEANLSKPVSVIAYNTATIVGRYEPMSFSVNIFNSPDDKKAAEVRKADYNSVVSLPAVKREGYTLKYWSITDAKGKLIGNVTGSVKMPLGNINATAVWERVNYTVTWVIDGEAVKKCSAPYASVLSGFMPAVSREGAGVVWQSVTGAGNAASQFGSDSRVPAGDITVTGTWKPSTHTVSWIVLTDKVEGNVNRFELDETVTYGSRLTPPEVPAPEGYSLVPWNIGLDYIIDDSLEAAPLTASFTMPDEDIVICSRWVPAAHTLTWVIDGREAGTSSLSEGESVMSDVPEMEFISAETGEAEAREGFTFSGWFMSGNQATAATLMPANDAVISGEWKRNTHNIIWTIDGEAFLTETAEYGAELHAPAVEQKEGYTLSGWTLDGESFTDGTQMPDRDIMLYASETVNTHSVTWMLDNETVSTDSVAYGSSLTPPAVTAGTGYTLYGWMLDGAPLTDSFTMPDNDIVIMSSRRANVHSVTWLVDGEEFLTETKEYDAELRAPAVEEKEGYTLSGWTLDGESFTDGLHMPDCDITVCAVRTANTHSVTWLLDNETVRTDSVAYGSSLTPPAVTAGTGYTLSGWMLDGAPLNDSFTMPDNGIVITNSRLANVHSVTWLVDGSTVRTDSVAYGTAVTAPVIPAEEGYTLSAWSCEGSNFADGMAMPDRDLIITAAKTINTHSLTFISDGAVVAADSAKEYGSEINLPALTKEGYTLKGWQADEAMLAPGTGMPDGDVTAVAVWEVNKYKVTWISDRKIVLTEELEYGSLITPPEISKEHYELDTWLLDGLELGDNETVPARDIRLTAEWALNRHTLTWVSSLSGAELGTLTLSYGAYLPAGPVVTEKKEGYSFSGWLLDGEAVKQADTMPDRDITLTTGWTLNTHIVAWMSEGKIAKRESVQFGSALTPPELKKEGYTVTGWTVNGMKLTDGYTMPDSLVTAVAEWTVNMHTVKWTIDGETVRTDTLAYGTAPEIPETEARRGFVLTAWKLDGEDYPEGYVMEDRDITVSAEWYHNVHIWDNGTVKKQGTCAETGLLVRKCRYCSATQNETLPRDRSNHAASVTTGKVEATCNTDGYTGDVFCSGCHALIKQGECVPRTGEHNWNPGKVETEPTCLLDGRKVYTCKKCGDTKSEVLPADASKHGETELKGALEATCVTEGYSGDKVCKECGAVIESGRTIPAAGSHSWNAGDVVVAATALTPGEKEYTCTVCGDKYSEKIPVEVKLALTAKAAVDGDAEYELRLEKLWDIAELLGADDLDSIKPAYVFCAYIGSGSDSEDRVDIAAKIGWSFKKADIRALRAGDELEVYVKPLSSDYAEFSFTVRLTHKDHVMLLKEKQGATCTLPGSAVYACVFCSAAGTEEIDTDPDTHISWYYVGAKSPTETESGYTGDRVCSHCGELLEEGSEIPADR